MNFFIKYKVHINIVLLIFWSYILYEGIMATNFSIQKLIVPILFISINLFNIWNCTKKQICLDLNKEKSKFQQLEIWIFILMQILFILNRPRRQNYRKIQSLLRHHRRLHHQNHLCLLINLLQRRRRLKRLRHHLNQLLE